MVGGVCYNNVLYILSLFHFWCYAMGIIQGIKDWVNFKSLVTPIFLKILFQILFWLTNIVWTLAILGVVAMGIMTTIGIAGQQNNDLTIAATGIVISLIIGLIMFGFQLLANFMLRVHFELMLLAFNIYDSLRGIEANTGKGKLRPDLMQVEVIERKAAAGATAATKVKKNSKAYR